MMPLESSVKNTVFFKPKYKWYKKLWYILTFRKYKLNEYQILDRQIKEIRGGDFMIFRKIKNKIKFKYQKAKKGYCDYDLYDIDGWFINVFPKMLEEFAECTCGHPADEEEMLKDVECMDKKWLDNQQSLLIDIRKKYTSNPDLRDGMSCWILILLRMKHCFEMCDEWNLYYEGKYRGKDVESYKKMNNEIENYKKEAFYLFEKYFFHLWW